MSYAAVAPAAFHAGAPVVAHAGVYAHPAPLAAPLNYNYAPVAPLTHTLQPVVQQQYAAPVVAHTAPVVAPATAYAVPAERVIQEVPVVEQAVEKVEQHGYSIRY